MKAESAKPSAELVDEESISEDVQFILKHYNL